MGMNRSACRKHQKGGGAMFWFAVALVALYVTHVIH